MTILENLMWLYLIGAVVMALYYIQLVVRRGLVPDSRYRWVLDPLKAGLMWPILVIQFLLWCRRNFK
jgi:hypothetical protein